MSSTIVPTFLAEVDGVGESGAMVLLSTNHPAALDPAIVRDGRIDRKVAVSRPCKADVTAILAMNKHVKKHAERIADEIFSEAFPLYTVKLKGTDVRTFTLGHIVSGAMCTGIAEKAVSSAMHREINGGKGGVTLEDALAAVKSTHAGARELTFTEDLQAFASGLSVDRIERAA
jgi:SpoVK/Ycf46/Vps4 family AAA+-type ATPase